MNKLEEKLIEIKKRKRIGLMTHLVIGYPSLEETISLVKLMEQNGVDIVELQIPFSDPLADGPTIMKACEASLKQGTKVKHAFAIMRQVSGEVSIPLVFMGYFNTLFTYGVEKFCQDAQHAGAAGLIVPDMPVDEENKEHYLKFCKKYKLHNIQVISPVSTDDRLKKNAKVANGFIYCTARQGITGAKNTLHPDLVSYLEKVKQFFDIPLAVGFGISKKEHIQVLKNKADIAIIGSAIMNSMNNAKKEEREKHVKQFLQNLREKS